MSEMVCFFVYNLTEKKIVMITDVPHKKNSWQVIS